MPPNRGGGVGSQASTTVGPPFNSVRFATVLCQNTLLRLWFPQLDVQATNQRTEIQGRTINFKVQTNPPTAK